MPSIYDTELQADYAEIESEISETITINGQTVNAQGDALIKDPERDLGGDYAGSVIKRYHVRANQITAFTPKAGMTLVDGTQTYDIVIAELAADGHEWILTAAWRN